MLAVTDFYLIIIFLLTVKFPFICFPNKVKPNTFMSAQLIMFGCNFIGF